MNIDKLTEIANKEGLLSIRSPLPVHYIVVAINVEAVDISALAMDAVSALNKSRN